MHVNKRDIPVKLNALGAIARHQGDFGTAAGTLAAEHLCLDTGVDVAPLLRSLDDGMCFAGHWGYLIRGRVVVTYDDGTTESCSAGEMFHWPAGHTVRVEDAAEIVMFSPAAEHQAVMNSMLEVLATLPA